MILVNNVQRGTCCLHLENILTDKYRGLKESFIICFSKNLPKLNINKTRELVLNYRRSEQSYSFTIDARYKCYQSSTWPNVKYDHDLPLCSWFVALNNGQKNILKHYNVMMKLILDFRFLNVIISLFDLIRHLSEIFIIDIFLKRGRSNLLLRRKQLQIFHHEPASWHSGIASGRNPPQCSPWYPHASYETPQRSIFDSRTWRSHQKILQIQQQVRLVLAWLWRIHWSNSQGWQWYKGFSVILSHVTSHRVTTVTTFTGQRTSEGV